MAFFGRKKKGGKRRSVGRSVGQSKPVTFKCPLSFSSSPFSSSSLSPCQYPNRQVSHCATSDRWRIFFLRHFLNARIFFPFFSYGKTVFFLGDVLVLIGIQPG